MIREPAPRKLNVLGTGVSATSYCGMLRLCRAWLDERTAGPESAKPARCTVILTVHSITVAWLDREYRKALNAADVGTPDGMPIVWALRSLGAAAQERVYGPELMIAVCGQAARLGHRVYLYGGREEMLPRLRENLLARFPALRIAGLYSPPFRALTPEEDAACVRNIRESGADIVFVGIGTPKQERWMHSHAERLPGTVLFGVGAAFDFHAGRVRQAPGWMQGAGLEWAFRLCMEPLRLWKRYLMLNPLFITLWLLQRLGFAAWPLPTAGHSAAERTV